MSKKYSNEKSNRPGNEKRKILVTRHFLERLLKQRERVSDAEDSVKSLIAMTTSITSHFSDAPSGTFNPHRQEDLIVKKLELENTVHTEREKLSAMETEAALCIVELPNKNWQTALRMRFIDAREIDDIAWKMHVDPRSVHRYIEHGCLNLKLPDRYYSHRPDAA